MPAHSSSSIPNGLTQLVQADQVQPAEARHLLAYLAAIDDPRSRAGRRHPLVAVLLIAAAAVLAGARSIAAIAEWAADTPQSIRAALGTRRDPFAGRWVVPTETTIRRTLARLDAEALAAAIGAWLADRDHPGRRRAVAVDGKTLRGAQDTQGRQVHLLAVMDHATRAVLAQRQVGGAPGEVPGFQPLLADLDLAGAVVTADALQTHREAAEFLVTSSRRIICSRSRPTSPRCWTAAPTCPGIGCPCWTELVTVRTGGSSCPPSRRSRSPGSPFPTPRRSSRSLARSATLTPGGGGP